MKLPLPKGYEQNNANLLRDTIVNLVWAVISLTIAGGFIWLITIVGIATLKLIGAWD